MKHEYLTHQSHHPTGTAAVAADLGISARQLDYWVRRGWIQLRADANGPGSLRVYQPDEIAAAREMVAELARIEAATRYVRSGNFFRDFIAESVVAGAATKETR